MTFIEYKALSPTQKAAYKIKEFFSLLPGRLKAFFGAIGKFFKNLVSSVVAGGKCYGSRFTAGALQSISILSFPLENI